MEFKIEKQWNGQPTGHPSITLTLSSCSEGLRMDFSAPFFNNPPNPGGEPGQPFPELWEYEVIEAFFLADDDKYLEVEFCPHGQHLLLLLSGCRNMIMDKLPLSTYQTSIQGSAWTGSVKIPQSYFPPNICRWNAYAIHGTGESRMYEALFPVPDGKFSYPDFHRLEYFKDINFSSLIPENRTELMSDTWTQALQLLQ